MPEPLEPLPLLKDEPVDEDDLGVQPFARIIAAAALGTQGPFTIGVYANWGEGKTSLLKLAKSLLDHSPNVANHAAPKGGADVAHLLA